MDIQSEKTDTQQPDQLSCDMPTDQRNLYFDNWKNKRKMAWVAMISMVIVTGLVMFVVPEARLEVISDPITWFFFSMASIVGAYMGFSVLASNITSK